MSSYLVGNLVGRLLISYIIVWLVIFIFSKFDWRRALTQTHTWYGLLSVGAIFLLGLAGALGQGGIA